MYQLKTKQTDEDVIKYLKTLWDEQKISDSQELIDIFSEVTGEPAKMWGANIIWFWKYAYTYASGHSWEYFIVGFSPKKSNITLYIIAGIENYKDLIKDIGKYKASGKSCMQIKKLGDINTQILKKLIEVSVKDMKEKYK